MYELDFSPEGFAWIDCSDSEQSVLSFMRHSVSYDQHIAVVCNFTPVPRHHYTLGVSHGGYWRELLNSDAQEYCGSGMGNGGGVRAEEVSAFGKPYRLRLTLPPLSVLFLDHQG